MYHVLFRSVLDSSVPFTFVMELWYTYMYPGARAYPRCTNYMYHCSDQFQTVQFHSHLSWNYGTPTCTQGPGPIQSVPTTCTHVPQISFRQFSFIHICHVTILNHFGTPTKLLDFSTVQFSSNTVRNCHGTVWFGLVQNYTKLTFLPTCIHVYIGRVQHVVYMLNPFYIHVHGWDAFFWVYPNTNLSTHIYRRELAWRYAKSPLHVYTCTYIREIQRGVGFSVGYTKSTIPRVPTQHRSVHTCHRTVLNNTELYSMSSC